jgi:hypothetical protein
MPPSGSLTVTFAYGVLDPRATAFVARTYYDSPHYRFDVPFGALLASMLEEDAELAPYATTYGVHDGDRLVGTCRRTARNARVPLPIEREWAIDVDAVARGVGAGGAGIYELGRMAIRSPDPTVMLLLLRAIDAHVVGADLFLSCLDRTVLASFARAGMPWRSLGDARDYLGTPTVAAAARVGDLRAAPFLRSSRSSPENPHLRQIR